MRKKKKPFPVATKLQSQFDSFVKRTIKNVIIEVISDYLEEKDPIQFVNIEDYEDIATPEVTPDVEKIKVALGKSYVLFENEILADGMKKLKEQHRQILECAFVLDMPNEAIAELLHLEYQTVCNYRHDAYKILRKYMEGEGWR